MNVSVKKTKWTIGLTAGAVLAAGALLAPAAASAHVEAKPDGAPTAGSNLDLTFGIGHGCDGSPTTSVRIEYPTEGIAGPKPIAQAGWSIEVENNGDAGAPSAVTFTPAEPVSDDVRAEVRINVGLLSDASGTLAFPVEQTCEDGSTSWDQVAEDGQDPHDLESPAPVLEVEPAEGAHGDGDHASDDAASAADDSTSALPVALGGAGLAAGVVALVVSVVSLRRRG